MMGLDNHRYNMHYFGMTSQLQQELKQGTPFPDRSVEAFLSVMRTAAVLEHELNDALRPHGITLTQYNVLRILRGSGDAGLCGREVGERMISKVPDVSRLLDRMEEMGLIARERDANDRRHVTARITDAGRQLVQTVDPALDAIHAGRFGSLGQDALDGIIRTLGAVRDAR
jgi:DNA-binding MarR family transcriptional regulator